MLPRCRTAGEPFVIPPFDVQVSDVEGFMDELQTFQSVFHDCFARSETRAHFWDDMGGQYSICAYLRPFPPTSPSRHVLLTPEVWARSLCQPGPHCAFLMPPTPWPAAQKTA